MIEVIENKKGSVFIDEYLVPEQLQNTQKKMSREELLKEFSKSGHLAIKGLSKALEDEPVFLSDSYAVFKVSVIEYLQLHKIDGGWHYSLNRTEEEYHRLIKNFQGVQNKN